MAIHGKLIDKKKKIGIVALMFCSVSILQAYESIRIGLYGRYENQLYRFYNGTALGNRYSTRTSQGYNAGVFGHIDHNYLFGSHFSLGFGEQKYSPRIKDANAILEQANLRLILINTMLELKIKGGKHIQPFVMAGANIPIVFSKTEIYTNPESADEIYSYPKVRFAPQLGIGAHGKLGKKWALHFSSGFRLLAKNKVGYDAKFNQFFGTISFCRIIKSNE